MTLLHGFQGGLARLPAVPASTNLPVQSAFVPPRLYLPVDKDTPLIVASGERVLGGQALTESTPAGSAAWHAPLAGKIIDVIDHPAPHASGLMTPTLVLEPDGSNDQVDFHPHGWAGLSVEQLQRQLESAGIIGMGGAGFPTWLKLDGVDRGSLTTLIINGVECEPGISCDDMLMREQPAKVIAATAHLAALLQVDRAVLALEDDCPEAFSALADKLDGVLANHSRGVELVSVPTRYPSGSEKQLIENLLGKQLPQGKFPTDIGVVCLNVATLCAMDDAVVAGRPLTSRVVTVTGDALAQPQNREVFFGTPVDALIEACGGLSAEVDALVMGGPMMGFALASPQVPIVKISNCILAQRLPVLTSHQPVMPCIRCGDCVPVCPAGLLPQQLYWFARSGEHSKAERHHLFDCIECGACAYVCPSQLPLVQYYRAAKSEIRDQRAQLVQADAARERMLARDERLARREREAAERRLAKRKGRKATTEKVDTGPSAEVAAAMARAKSLQQAERNRREPAEENSSSTSRGADSNEMPE